MVLCKDHVTHVQFQLKEEDEKIVGFPLKICVLEFLCFKNQFTVFHVTQPASTVELNMVIHYCSVCKKESEQSCSLCNRVYYCSKEHQVQDWKRGHKNKCAPFKIATNNSLDRHLVSTCDISEGDVILQRKPLVICPKIVSFPLCLGCHKKLNLSEDFCACRKCSWPICGAECESTDLHKDECEILSENNFKPQIIPADNTKQSCYSIIGPLRALLLKQKSKGKFEALMSMQSHLKDHKDSPLYMLLKKSIVPIIMDKFKIETDEEEILTICSIFDTNAFDVRDAKGLVNVRALYSTASLISHDCKQNTRHYFTDDFEINVSATVPIKKGEIITTSYTQSLWGTQARRAHLKQSKNFDCACDRCRDSTEFGLYVGSIYCSNCRESDKSDVSSKMISTDPLDLNADFECQICGHTMAAKQIKWGNDALRQEILSLGKSDPERFEMFLDKYKDVLHNNNSHVLEVKYALSQMYGNLDNYNISDVSDEIVQRKIDLCHELLNVADVICPGSSRFRGSLLYDLQAAMVVQAKRDYEQEKITKQMANDNLLEAMTILQESAKILSVEPDMKALLEQRLENLSKYLD